jgi:hypothetical protein
MEKKTKRLHFRVTESDYEKLLSIAVLEYKTPSIQRMIDILLKKEFARLGKDVI